MTDFLIRIELEPWTSENYRQATERMLANGFVNELKNTHRSERLPPGEFVLSGALTVDEVESRVRAVLVTFGVPFAVLVTSYSDLRYSRSSLYGRTKTLVGAEAATRTLQ